MAIEHALAYSIILSPLVLILTTLLGIAVALYWRRIGWICAVVSLAAFYLLATPCVADQLIWALEHRIPANQSGGASPGAIVVLSGDIDHTDVGVRLGLLSLERVYFAAEQYRESSLPILVTGGPIGDANPAVADLMAETLSGAFGIPVRWREIKARTTYENAEYSARILKNAGINTVIVVTQRWHMPRAIWSFGKFGIRGLPTKFAPGTGSHRLELGDLVPTAAGLLRSTYATHELLGIVYYKMLKH